ncbi:MAG: MATE family efflux transporter [Bacteroidota bacterium]|nr:MATE family efflux transporter [Bacteroidota bacterium]
MRTLFALTKQALAGEHLDYTTGSIRRAVLLLSIPMILEMCMESLFAGVDIFFVGRLGKEAVETVALTESATTVVYSVAIGLSMAATALVARRVGEKEPAKASRSAAQAINVSLLFTLLFSLIGAFGAGGILHLMGGTKEVVDFGSSFTRIIFSSTLFIMLLYLINGIFRGAGSAFTAMKALWIANGCNIILCPIMIHFYGLPGAAIATTIGRGVGVCYQVFYLFGGKGVIQIRLRQFAPDWLLIGSVIKVAWTGAAQFLIGAFSWVVMTRMIAKNFGSVAVDGYVVAIRILLFFLLPAWGMSNAAATLVGQNLGAKRPDRAEQSVWTAARYNTVFMILVSLLVLVWAEPVVGFINKDPGIIAVGVRALHIISMGYIFYGVGMVMTNAFNGAGDTRTPTVLNLVVYWAFQMPAAWIMAVKLNWGPTGVFIAILSAEMLITIASFVIFRKGRWKKVKI